MANIFTPSGKVIPASGTINFNSNASSNAVRQVFGETTSNMSGLTGSNVDDGTRPPPFTALTVPTAASGNLKLSYFRGKSAFLTSPSAYTISNITTTTLTPTLANGGGTSYQIAVGTTAGASNTVGWRAAANGTQITGLTFTVGSNYYISVYSSNATNSTASLAVSNLNAYGIPNPATGVTLAVTSLTNWSFSWIAPASGIQPTGYSWYLNTVNNSISGAIASGTTTAPTVTTGPKTTTLTSGTSYYGLVYATRPEASSTLAVSATAYVFIGPPTSFSVNNISNTTYTVQATGSTGATSYSYYLYNQTGQFIAPQKTAAAGTSVTFTGLGVNTQYYVGSYAFVNGTSSTNLLNSSSIWCLSPPTQLTVATTMGSSDAAPGGSISWTMNAPNATSVAISYNGVEYNAGIRSTWTYSSSNLDQVYPSCINSNRFTTIPINITVTSPGSRATSSNIYMVHAIASDSGIGGGVINVTPPSATTVNVYAVSGKGGHGTTGDTPPVLNTLGVGGAAAYTSTSFASVAGSAITCYIGESGSNFNRNGRSVYAYCGDGTLGGNGGRYYYDAPIYGGGGGWSGGGGAATFIKTSGVVIVLGGGGGGGAGNGGQAAYGGYGGYGGGAGGDGKANGDTLTGAGGYHSGGFPGMDGYGGAAGDVGNDEQQISHGDGGFGTNATNTGTSTTALGNGGDGVAFYGNVSGGGGGGYGGGGGGDAVNDGAYHESAGGGGGGSYSSTGSALYTVTSTYLSGGAVLLWY